MRVKLSEVYSQSLALWPEEIMLSDCELLGGKSIRWPSLIRYYHLTEDLAGDDLLKSIMCWKIYCAFAKIALTAGNKNLSKIIVKMAPEKEIVDAFWKFYLSEDSTVLRKWCRKQSITLINDYE